MRSSVFCIASGASHAISGTRRSAVTDAVGLAPSLLPSCSHVRAPSPSPSPPPRLRVSGVVWCDACVLFTGRQTS